MSASLPCFFLLLSHGLHHDDHGDGFHHGYHGFHHVDLDYHHDDLDGHHGDDHDHCGDHDDVFDHGHDHCGVHGDQDGQPLHHKK